VRLRDAGLQRINISLDTLDPKRFQQLARRDQMHQTLAGIHAAIDAGFESIKLNTLAISGAVENEIIDLARFALDRKLELRFIEFMPLDAAGNWKPGAVLDGEKILRILRTHFYPVQIADGHRGAAPAERYRVGDGHIGIIRSVTRPFCDACDRLRLSADGAIRNCLFSQDEMSIRDLLRAPATGPTPPPDRIDNAILDAFQHSVSVKRAGHRIGTDDFRAPERPMYSIGG
ncbi:MAG: radical SAM protein, partial [Planctomycetota bacterium]